MGHDATKVLLGSSQSSAKVVDNFSADPATFVAGLCVSLKSDGTLSLAASDGPRIGISMGTSLSDTKRTAIARSGLRIPIKITSGFSPTLGAAVAVSETTGKAKAYTGTGDAYINATYASGALTSVSEAGVETATDVALIDMPGGV